jgi:hypothetical protein
LYSKPDRRDQIPLQHVDDQRGRKRQRNHNYRRVLPLLAYWTLACDLLHSFTHQKALTFIGTSEITDEMIELIGMSNGRSFPIPLWLFEELESSGFMTLAMKHGIQFRAAFAFHNYYSFKGTIDHQLSLALLRYTCPLLPEGPLLAYQRRRRLPDRSLITLITVGATFHGATIYGKNDRDIWSSNWKDGSVLPQRVLITNHNGETHEIGILHQQLSIVESHHRHLVSVLLPHCRYLNAPMIYSELGAVKRRPIEIVSSQGDRDLMQQLLSAGAEPLSPITHDNEVNPSLTSIITRHRKTLRRDDIPVSSQSTTTELVYDGQYQQVVCETRPKYTFYHVNPKNDMYNSVINDYRQLIDKIYYKYGSRPSSRGHRRVLPLLAYWTTVCDLLAPGWESSFSKSIYLELADDALKLIKMSGQSLPIPLWLFNPKWWQLTNSVQRHGVQYLTAFAFRYSTWRLSFSQLGSELLRYTCPLLPEGPLLAYQRRRRLPDRSLVTLISFDDDDRDRDVWTSHWKDGSILPQRAIKTFPDLDGKAHTVEIGILHHILHNTSSELRTYRQRHGQLASALIPYCGYLHTRMPHSYDEAEQRLPMEIAALQGHKELLEQLGAAGAAAPTLHDNDVKLRQFLRHSDINFQIGHLSWKSLTDFEIDWHSDDIIRQGQHSRVYKASPKWIDEKPTEYQLYAVKIIPLTSTTTIEKIAHEILVVDRWSPNQGVHRLIGLEANDVYVAIITPFAEGGTLEEHLPRLMELKHTILNNNDSLTIDERCIKYLKDIRPIVDGLFFRFMSHRDVLHRDLRLSNIVLTKKDDLKSDDVRLIDYGLATRVGLSSHASEDKQRSDPYFYCVNAPEVFSGGEYTFESEMWSFGMILLSLWTCEKPFNDELLTNPLVSMQGSPSVGLLTIIFG